MADPYISERFGDLAPFSQEGNQFMRSQFKNDMGWPEFKEAVVAARMGGPSVDPRAIPSYNMTNMQGEPEDSELDRYLLYWLATMSDKSSRPQGVGWTPPREGIGVNPNP